MCGRFNGHLPKMHDWSDALTEWPSDSDARYNTYPTANITAFTGTMSSGLSAHTMRWQLVPTWAKEYSVNYPSHNARLETIDQRPTFKNAWNQAQRCLIPMGGFFEREQSGARQWHYITDPAAGCLLVAGLYEKWRDALHTHSCTIITKEATSTVAELHPRSPILLTKQSAQHWLSSELKNPKQFLSSLNDVTPTAYPVGSRVGNARNNDAALITREPKIRTLF